MSELISREELAKRLEVSPHRITVATREEEWVRRQYPVADWAVYDEDGQLVGYEVPEVVRRRLGIGGGAEGRKTGWFDRFLRVIVGGDR